MKKILAIMALAAAGAAGAAEVGIQAGTATGGNNRTGYGVTIGDTFAGTKLTAGVERFTREANDQTRLSLVGAREVTNLAGISLQARAGAAYLNNRTGADGSALLIGVAASYPVTKTVAAVVSVDRQFGQRRIAAADGNVITAGIRVSF